ncbi:MAG: aldehyde dehydrogenase family protein, partial [Renibacterium salmoninarum]|nr:aldehyde dehydrogenase family protein [Renibacterium salmoninarum]
MNTTAVLNPATEETIAQVSLASLEETDAAIERAAQAYQSWRLVSPADRARLLRRFAECVDAHLEELAQLEVDNAGHTLGNARWEAGNVRDVLHYYAGAPERHLGQQIPVAGGVALTFHEPLGVVGIIVPWNFPMPIAGWGFAPALAAGNTVVLKPAELTPLTAIRLGELALQAGIPEGVLTVLPGKGSVVGERFVSHPLVRKIVFTGSTAVGKRIMAGCADQVKRLTLELGGKSANIVFADADLEAAAAAAPGGAFDNAGQDCCARSRILVERSVFDRFLELLEPAVAAFSVGDPRADGTAMGPLISAAQRDAVAGFIAQDSSVAFRGSAPEGKGFWFPP